MPFGRSQEPKPYDFVPLPDRVDRTEPAGHAVFKKGLLSGVITGELVALTPMHVASGNIELTQSDRIPLVKAHFRTGGKIAIPGSSLKGAVRSIVEAITHSCVRVQSRTTRERLERFNRDFLPCDLDKHHRLCPACRLFGAMGYQGQVWFADAVLLEGGSGIMLAPSLFTPRFYARIYYDRNGQVKGRKFYFHGQPAKGNVPLEVCDVKSRFRLHLDFTNLTEAELGVLFTALGRSNPSFALKLGGAKPVCCGSVEVHIAKAETQDIAHGALEFDNILRHADWSHWLTPAETLLVRPNLEWLHKILKLDGQRLCPSESY